MVVGVVKEIKENENRVALAPAGVELLRQHDHTVLVQRHAGRDSGFSDEEYRAAGAEIIEPPEEIYIKAGMILKVKEPLLQEFPLIRPGQIIFTFFHFAASRALTDAMMQSKSICIAYETVEKNDGSLPILIPMSEVAGRMAVQEGAKYLEKTYNGRGILLGGIPGVNPANVIILGGGVVGANAALIAAGMGARVTILDIDLQRLRYLHDIMPRNVITVISHPQSIRETVSQADLVIGAVLIAGARTPRLISREMLQLMKPGAVIVDVAVDQGGCVATSRPTSHREPTFVVDGIIHYAVANMPSAVPITSTIGLTNATLPYILEIADAGFAKAVRANREIALGANIVAGKVTHQRVAEAFALPYVPPEQVNR